MTIELLDSAAANVRIVDDLCMTCGEAGSVGGYSYSISQHINSTTEECCVKTKVKNQYFHCFVWPASWGRERETETRRRRHRGRETRHIDLKGFSPYITVRSTLQPPLEREHLVNTSSSGQSLQSDFTLIWLHEDTQSEVHMLLCKMKNKKIEDTSHF